MPVNKPLIKLGQINFINCLPVNLPLQSLRVNPGLDMDFTVIEGVPSKLNLALRNAEIDIAPVSSFEYLSNKKLYETVPGLSITSFEKADSVILFLKNNLEINQVQEIFITNKSASSVNLLKILLQDFWGLNLDLIKFVTFDMDPADCSAKLLIGDEALKQNTLDSQFKAIDLGTAWYEYSGLPMVFGLWTFNKQAPWFSELRIKDCVIKLLNSCRDLGLDQFLPDVIVEAYRITGIPKKTLATYFRNLNYSFSSPHQEGLSYYESKLKQFNLIKESLCR